MKTPPAPPQLDRLSALGKERLARVLYYSTQLNDFDYLHWEELRHRKPPELPELGSLTAEEWWLAIKLKRRSNQLVCPELHAGNHKALHYTRHPRIEHGVVLLDRMLSGQVSLPEPVNNQSTRNAYIASSLMEEAIHSSLFEGAVSTREAAKELLRSQRKPVSRDEQMILNNYRAMERIVAWRERPLDRDMVLELHRILTQDTLDQAHLSGRMQSVGETRIQVIDHRINRVVHTPPPAAERSQRLDNLIRFANADDLSAKQFIHPVVRSILIHFQLAYDHLFYDDNGRTARALFYWSMLYRGYWLAEYLSISRLLHRNRKPCERAYQYVESDEQDATYFVLQQLNVLSDAITELRNYIQLKSQQQTQVHQLLNQPHRFNHRQISLLKNALNHPSQAITHESHAATYAVTTVTARSDILGLANLGLLRKTQSGRQHYFYPADNLETRLRELRL